TPTLDSVVVELVALIGAKIQYITVQDWASKVLYLVTHPDIHLNKIIRLIDGPLAPFGDAEQLRVLIDRDLPHRALYQVFLDVRDAAAKILEHTTLADLIAGPTPRSGKGGKKQRNPRKKEAARILPMVV